MKLFLKRVTIFVLAFAFFGSVFAQTIEQFGAPEWSKGLSIYEVNLRQYTPSGTIKEFIEHLPRLKKMGVGILWLMPVNPIGEINRKGTLGSYYSVKDYVGINSELGTTEDFKLLVNKVHEMGMYLIIDWVANHTSWDNEQAKLHPEFYKKDKSGNFIPPVPDWKDVIALNYENKDLWNYMTGAMSYWVKECNIDGFRCDVASFLPNAFWQFAIPKLQKIKPVFMLAEAEEVEMHDKAFNMTYSWDLYHLGIDVADGKKKPSSLLSRINYELKKYPLDGYRMRFTTNHDENSWNGTSVERFKKTVDAANVFMATVPGMFMVYSGQEAGEPKRLDFFERDPIRWAEHPNKELFTKLIMLKKNNQALWNGKDGGEFIALTDSTSDLISYLRVGKKSSVLVFLNFTDKEQTVAVGNRKLKGLWKNYFEEKTVRIGGNYQIKIKPYGYSVWVKE